MLAKQKYSLILPLCLLLSLGLIWGSGYAIAKYAIQNQVTPLGYAFWQSLGPAVLLSLICLKEQKSFLVKQDLKFYIVCALLGIVIPNTLMYFVVKYLPAGILAVLVNTVPLFIYPLSLVCRLENFNFWRLAAIIMGFVGIYLMLMHQIVLPASFLPWGFLALICPLSFALCAIFISKKKPSSMSVFQATKGMLIFSTIFLLPVVFFSHHFYWPNWPFKLPDYAILIEILLSTLGYLIFFHLIKTAGAVYYSMVGGVVALTGLFWGWIFFGETLTLLSGFAIALVLSAIIVLSILPLQKKRQIV